MSLNAPNGARCFLKFKELLVRQLLTCLNAPYGAQWLLAVRLVMSTVAWGNAMQNRQCWKSCLD